MKLKIAARNAYSITNRFVLGQEFDVITFDVLNRYGNETLWTHCISAWEDLFLFDSEEKISSVIKKIMILFIGSEKHHIAVHQIQKIMFILMYQNMVKTFKNGYYID